MTTKKTVVFDLDDTLVNLRDPMCRAMNHRTGANMSWREWRHYNLLDIYGVSLEWFLNLMVKDEVLEQALPEINARECVHALLASDIQVEVWPARRWHPFAAQITRRQMGLIGAPVEGLRLFDLDESKAEAVSKRDDICLFLDDNPAHIQGLSNYGKDILDRGRLMHRPWNASCALSRCNDIDEVKQIVTQLSSPASQLSSRAAA